MFWTNMLRSNVPFWFTYEQFNDPNINGFNGAYRDLDVSGIKKVLKSFLTANVNSEAVFSRNQFCTDDIGETDLYTSRAIAAENDEAHLSYFGMEYANPCAVGSPLNPWYADKGVNQFVYKVRIIKTTPDGENGRRIMKKFVDKGWEEVNIFGENVGEGYKVAILKCPTYVANNKHLYVVFIYALTDPAIRKILAEIGRDAGVYDDDWYRALFNGNAQQFYTIADTKVKAIIQKGRRKANEKSIKDAMSSLNNTQRNDLSSRIADAKQTIASYEREIEQYHERISNLQMQLFNIEQKGEGYMTEFIDFLTDHALDSITHFVLYDRTYLRFMVTTPCMYYDSEAISIMKSSNFRNSYHSMSEKYRRLVDAIFIDERFGLMIQQGFQYDVRNNRVKRWVELGYTEGMSNPHIHEYDCWGDNERPIRQFLQNKDYVGAWCQTMSALASINFYDSPVVSRFFDRFASFEGIACIIDKETDELLTMDEAYNLLLKEEQEKQDNTEQNEVVESVTAPSLIHVNNEAFADEDTMLVYCASCDTYYLINQYSGDDCVICGDRLVIPEGLNAIDCTDIPYEDAEERLNRLGFTLN